MKRDAIISFSLVAITFAAFLGPSSSTKAPKASVFWGVGSCDFVSFDDPGYLLLNSHVRTGLSWTNFKWAWTTFDQGNYLPLTWLSFMLDVRLFGFGPHPFHLMNLAFHAANAVLLYLFFRNATGAIWRSALVAAVFAVHPLRVESVAWVVERKDVLTGFFGLLTMLAYLKFTREKKLHWYATTLILFAATLLAKQIWCTLPCVLLLLDYWPLGRWVNGPPAPGVERPRRTLPMLIIEKLPLIAMSAGILCVTLKAQAQDHALIELGSVPMWLRLENVPVSYARYLGKMVWFGNLAIVYPIRQWNYFLVAGACLLLIAITAVCVAKFRRAPWLLVGWLWFVGALVPMSGLVQLGPQAMADRFTYFPGIGIAVMVAWSIPASAGKRPVFVVAWAGTAIALLMLFTAAQTSYWRTNLALFSHSALADESQHAELQWGTQLLNDGHAAAGILHLQKAVEIDKGRAKTQAELAMALANNGRADEALDHARLAVAAEPNNPQWRCDLAYVHCQRREYDAAERQCRRITDANPNYAYGHMILGFILLAEKEADQARAEFLTAVSLDPTMTQARKLLKQIDHAKDTR